MYRKDIKNLFYELVESIIFLSGFIFSLKFKILNSDIFQDRGQKGAGQWVQDQPDLLPGHFRRWLRIQVNRVSDDFICRLCVLK